MAGSDAAGSRTARDRRAVPAAAPTGTPRLIGRDRERAALQAAVARLQEDLGGLVLVSGDAGAGKTTLVEAAVSETGLTVLRGGGRRGDAPDAPLTSALRTHLRTGDGEVAEDTIGSTFEELAARSPTIVFLDDLQWADAATLALLARWAAPSSGLALLVVGAYRSDGLARDHPLRALRSALRRTVGGAERQVHLGPLSLEASRSLIHDAIGGEVSPAVIDAVYRRARGLPFYLEELARAVAASETEAAAGSANEVVPESVRDAVLQQVAELSEVAQRAAEIAAAATPIDGEILLEVVGEDALEELLERGVLVEVDGVTGRSGQLDLRHALVGEALYTATPWARRRRHHARLASALEATGTAPMLVATHWDRAHEPARARPLLIAAAEQAGRLHAYRDAKEAIDRALAMWPPDEDQDARIRVVQQLGDCAERCGELADAARAWEEVAAAHRDARRDQAFLDVERRLAGLYELTNEWPRALAARRVTADGFARRGQLADAAAEQLAAAHL